MCFPELVKRISQKTRRDEIDDLRLIIFGAEMQLEVPGSPRPVAGLWGTISLGFCLMETLQGRSRQGHVCEEIRKKKNQNATGQSH